MMTHTWIMGRRWAVVQCVPNSEALAAQSATELGHMVFFPRYKETVVRSHRKPVERRMAYIPGYLFVEDSRYARDGRPLSLWELGKAKGVASVLKVGSEYATVSDTDAVMQCLLKMADDQGFVKREIAGKPISLIKEGDTVVIRQGPFADFEAIVAKVSQNRKVAEVWAQLFGRPTLLKVETVKLKKVAA